MRVGRKVLGTLTLALLASATVAGPAAAQGRGRGLLRLGGDYGGERVLQFTYSDGSSPKVTAGGGLLLSAGGTFRAFESRGHGVDGQLSVGLKYRTIPPAGNQDANWLRFPVEALLFYRAPGGVRVGGGATVHFANALRTSGEALDQDVEFRTAPGAVIQAEYHRGNVAFDLRYTMLRYEIESGGSGSIDANSFGGGLSFFFGRGGGTRP